MKSAIAWFAENHVAANLLMIFMLLAGILTLTTIKMEVFPETTLDMISITTLYPGASPAEVEEAVIRRIEEKVAGLAGIKRIDSNAREGSGTVTIEVMKNWDQKKLLDEVKAEVDRITTMPDEAEKPVVSEVTQRIQVLQVAVYGDVPEATLKHLAEKIKDDLTNLPGITLAEVAAVRTAEIHIEISETTLRRYGLTLGGVAQIVARESLDLPAGSVKTTRGEILVRTKGRRYYAPDFRDIAVITRSDGTKVTLGQIADIREGFSDVDLYAKFQGKPAAMIIIYRVADQNALDVADTTKAYLDEIRPELPEGVKIDYFADMSKILRSRIQLLMKNMAFGLVLVAVLLGFFLNIRLAFWVTLGIPISFAAAAMFLPIMDVSINMISLFAFIMVLGIVVDDAIIVGENVFRYTEEGKAPITAAIDGTYEVGQPVIFSVLTTIVAFSPLIMVGGDMGNFMRNIPIVVTLVLFGSLIESLFILPAHLNRSKAARTSAGNKKYMARVLERIIHGPYAKLVDRCVKWRYITFAAGITLLILTFGMFKAGKINYIFFPKVEGDTLECLITMPSGTPPERTGEVADAIELKARELIEELEQKRAKDAPSLLEHTTTLVGAQFGRHGDSGDIGGHLAQVWVQLLEGEYRDISSMELNQMWRKRVGKIPDAETVVFKSEIHSAGNAVEVHLSHDDHETLVAAVEDFKTELETYAGVFDIGDSFLPGKKEMQLKLKPAARGLGLTLADLAGQVRHAFYGAEALRFQRDKDEVKVLVRYPEKERRSLGYVEEMRIRTPDGAEVPFSQVAEVDMEQGYATIQRAQRLRVIKVTADVNENIANSNEIRKKIENIYLPQLTAKYPGLRFTIEGEGREQKESMGDLGKWFAVALFSIFALLAIPFKSFTQPIIVMLAIPFGMVGAVIGHLIMGFDISFISMFGIVGLSGVVVNDSLVLIHRANRFMDEGFNAFDSVTMAGKLRFRAIILTSLTTFAGLTPMLLEKSIQARFLIPMAVSLGFGVLFATFITLLLIPCGYVILDDIHNLFRKMVPGKTEESGADI